MSIIEEIPSEAMPTVEAAESNGVAAEDDGSKLNIEPEPEGETMGDDDERIATDTKLDVAGRSDEEERTGADTIEEPQDEAARQWDQEDRLKEQPQERVAVTPPRQRSGLSEQNSRKEPAAKAQRLPTEPEWASRGGVSTAAAAPATAPTDAGPTRAAGRLPLRSHQDRAPDSGQAKAKSDELMTNTTTSPAAMEWPITSSAACRRQSDALTSLFAHIDRVKREVDQLFGSPPTAIRRTATANRRQTPRLLATSIEPIVTSGHLGPDVSVGCEAKLLSGCTFIENLPANESLPMQPSDYSSSKMIDSFNSLPVSGKQRLASKFENYAIMTDPTGNQRSGGESTTPSQSASSGEELDVDGSSSGAYSDSYDQPATANQPDEKRYALVVLKHLMQRRDELRTLDRQLFNMMAQYLSKLDQSSACAELGAQMMEAHNHQDQRQVAADSRLFEYLNGNSDQLAQWVDYCDLQRRASSSQLAIDLSVGLKPEQQRSPDLAGGRQPLSSGQDQRRSTMTRAAASVNFRKSRLLEAMEMSPGKSVDATNLESAQRPPAKSENHKQTSTAAIATSLASVSMPTGEQLLQLQPQSLSGFQHQSDALTSRPPTTQGPPLNQAPQSLLASSEQLDAFQGAQLKRFKSSSIIISNQNNRSSEPHHSLLLDGGREGEFADISASTEQHYQQHPSDPSQFHDHRLILQQQQHHHHHQHQQQPGRLVDYLRYQSMGTSDQLATHQQQQHQMSLTARAPTIEAFAEAQSLQHQLSASKVVDPSFLMGGYSGKEPIYLVHNLAAKCYGNQAKGENHYPTDASSLHAGQLGNSIDLARSSKEFQAAQKMSYRCHVCGSGFEDRHRLQQHLSIHLNLHPSWFEEKTIKETMAQYESRRGDYLCGTCKLRYETTAEFDKHMQLHGDKPHQCELCGQDNKMVAFRYYRQLLTHLRSHCFLYSCKFAPECKQTANRKDYLKLHILKHHLNNKLPEQYTICCQ